MDTWKKTVYCIFFFCDKILNFFFLMSKVDYSQIRQIPKIAGTVVVETRVSTDTPQTVPDKALSVQAIGDIMYSYGKDAGVSERSLPADKEEEIEREHWEYIRATEEQRMTDAEKMYNSELQRLLKECDNPQSLE